MPGRRPADRRAEPADLGGTTELTELETSPAYSAIGGIARLFRSAMCVHAEGRSGHDVAGELLGRVDLGRVEEVDLQRARIGGGRIGTEAVDNCILAGLGEGGVVVLGVAVGVLA